MNALSKLMTRFAETLSQGAPQQILTCFIADDPAVSLLFGTQEEWARGPDEVAAAIEAFVEQEARPHVAFEEVQAHAIGTMSHIVSGLVTYRWTEGGCAQKRASRFNLVARQHGDAFGVLHFAEAPIAPLIELQQHYQRIAEEGHVP